jgi:hypothetical protein
MLEFAKGERSIWRWGRNLPLRKRGISPFVILEEGEA